MRAELWALLTAACWATGSLLEKRGVISGGLAPVMGTTVRTLVSLAFLTIISFPYWGQVRAAGSKPIALIALGGGILAGGLGIMFLYTGLKHGHLSTVMTIAFCMAPVLGTVLGYLFLNERLSLVQTVGIVLCVAGAAMVTFFKQG
ncbi:MAG: EamA family transporter [Thermodesulfobacteriota bacterium]|nr:EamA family transporter [Thermodesulfobacteriota bacterium]